MRYKTSCFNPAIARNDLQRFWPLPLAVLGIVFLRMVLLVLNAAQQRATGDEMSQTMAVEQIYNTGNVMVFLLAGAVFLAAALTFRHLHSRREIQFYHALPVKRRCLFTTSYLTGLAMIALPMILGALAGMAAAAGNGWGIAVLPMLKLLGAGMAALLMLYSMAVIACCLAGQTFGAVLIYGGMNCAVLVIVSSAGALAGMFMPGIDFNNFLVEIRTWLTPVMKLCLATICCAEAVPMASLADSAESMVLTVGIPEGFAEPLTLGIYGVLGVALAGLAGVLYQKRRGELAGEMIAFQPVRSLCRIFGALMIATGGAYVVLSTSLFQGWISFAAVVLLVLAFGALGWIAAEMVIQKTLRVFRKRTILSCGILMAALLAAMVAGKADLFGVVRYVPEAGDVESATACYSYGNDVTMTPADAAALHRAALDHQAALANNVYGQSYTELRIAYTMKNGRHIQRTYRILDCYDEAYHRLEDPISQAAMEILQRPEYNYQTWFGNTDGSVTGNSFYHGSVSGYNWDDQGEPLERVVSSHPAWRGNYMDLTAQEAVELYEAICRDIQAETLPPQGFQQEESLGCVDLQYYTREYSVQYGTYQRYTETVPMNYVSVALLPGMENTLECLRGMGFTFYTE